MMAALKRKHGEDPL
jgi:hypothetical protein